MAGPNKKLIRGVGAQLTDPQRAARSCQDCRAYLYHPETGEPRQDFDGGPLPRPANVPVECETSAGCVKGHWKDPAELDDHGRRILQHWRGCRATGHFPNDPLVKYHAAILQQLHQAAGKEL